MRYLMIILTGSLRRIQIRLFIAYMRKTFELLFKTEYSVLYIEHVLGENHIQGRGDTWKEYESRFRKHLEK